MSVLLVSCESDAEETLKALEKLMTKEPGVHIGQGCYLVESKDHPRVLSHALGSTLPQGTTFYVFELTHRYDGFGPVDTNQWLKKHLKK